MKQINEPVQVWSFTFYHKIKVRTILMAKNEKLKSTIRDIAKLSGLSIGCISNYLNGKLVRESSKVKIEKAIKELNYTIDEYARGLATGKTKQIGVIIPSFSNIFYGELAHQINLLFLKHGYSVSLNEHNFDSNKEKVLIESMQKRRVDGFVVVPAGSSPSDYQYLNQDKVIFVDKFIEGLDSFDFVLLNNRLAGASACDEFVKYGHKEVAMIYNGGNSYTGNERLRGFVDAAQKYGIHVDTYSYDETIENAYEVIQTIYETKKYTGVFASNYISTLGAIFYMNKMDITVPNDISLIGFDNMMLTSLFKPKLTIINQPLDEIASYAVNLLIDKLSHPREEGKRIFVNSQMIYGASIKKLKK